MLKYKNLIDEDPILNQIMPFLSGYNAFLIGGYIRDILIGKVSPDRDIVVENCDIETLSKKIANRLKGHFIPLDTENNIYRIVLSDKKNYIDLTAPIENNITKDILRRDLTINAIAYDINNKEFIDIARGFNDLTNKLIKGIDEQNIIDDPLRLLRIFRFNSTLGFRIDSSLKEQVKRHAPKILLPAKERINAELIKLFEGDYANAAIKEMDELGLLEYLFPIIKEVKKVPSNSHHHLDLFNHSIETLTQIQKYINDSPVDVKKHMDSKNFGGAKQSAYLKLAGFLHDIGKPSTWTIEEETQKHRFIKHDDVGSKLVIPILKELKFSKKQISYIQKMIKYHIYPSTIVCYEETNEKARMRFFRKMEEYSIDAIILAMADRLSARGPEITQDIINTNINGLKSLLTEYLNIRENLKPLEKLLDGIEIMEILDIKASKQLGNVIKQLKEAQLNGEVTTKTEAISFIKELSLN